jgi:hypothetical protein
VLELLPDIALEHIRGMVVMVMMRGGVRGEFVEACLEFEHAIAQFAQHVALRVRQLFDPTRFTRHRISRGHDPCRNTDGGTVRGDVFDNDRPAADPGACADGNRPEDARTHTDDDTVF